ncbi:hypothetical protein ABDK56_00760 [Sphingomonas sp. ASV193]|uniref:hypothetical protein n=1 Tax=Sphingomonas sp. ASV193 TaxID=3144405 RepID=UPI0032E86558
MTDNTITPAAPVEEPTPAEIAEAGKLRPLESLGSVWVQKGPATNEPFTTPTADAFDPETRDRIRREAQGDPKAEARLVAEEVRSKSRQARLIIGAADMTAAEAEALDQRNNIRLIDEESVRLNAELMAVDGYITVQGPNGEPFPEPVLAIAEGSQRYLAMKARLNELAAQRSLIMGREGQKALDEAAKKDAIRNREIKSQIEDRKEIDRRASEIARERRLNAAAETKAKFL